MVYNDGGTDGRGRELSLCDGNNQIKNLFGWIYNIFLEIYFSMRTF